MELLDLSLHDRDEYEGKVVECSGRRYIVGDLLGVGAERVVHVLTNEQSRLSLLVVKILKHPRPRGPYTKLIAQMRTNPELARIVTITLEVDVPGGMVEFQPNATSTERDDGAAEHVRRGFALLTDSNPALAEAEATFLEALRINQFHTEALYGIAHVLWRAGRTFEALSRIEQAVEIEPSVLHYRRTHVELLSATQQHFHALYFCRQAMQLFENVHDLDELATEMLLDAGQPEEARERVTGAMVGAERRVALEKEVEDAIAARGRARQLMQKARASVMAHDWPAASSTLLRAQEIYNRDPELCMNTAFATLHDGDPRICAGLMLHASTVVSEPLAATCAANAGFALLKAQDVAMAVGILEMAAIRLSALCGGRIPDNEIDLPSVGVWIEDQTVREERISVAEALVSRGMAQADAQGIDVPDPVRTLAAGYRQAAATSR